MKFVALRSETYNPNRLQDLNEVLRFKGVKGRVENTKSLLQKAVDVDNIDGVDFNRVDPGTVAVMDLAVPRSKDGMEWTSHLDGIVQHQDGELTGADVKSTVYNTLEDGRQSSVYQRIIVEQNDGDTIYRFPDSMSPTSGEHRITTTADGHYIAERGSWEEPKPEPSKPHELSAASKEYLARVKEKLK